MTVSSTNPWDKSELEKTKIPSTIPILPVKGTVLFPYISIPILINEGKSSKLIDEIVIREKIFGIVAQSNSSTDDPEMKDMYQYGVAAKLFRMLRLPDNTIRIIVHGIRRIQVNEYLKEVPYFLANVTPLDDEVEKGMEIEALTRNVSAQFQKVISMQPYLPDELQIVVMNLNSPSLLADLAAANLNLNVAEKQDILETLPVKQRLEKIFIHLNKELEVLELGSKIQKQVQQEMDKSQRNFLLREQMKAIQKELGEDEDERKIEFRDIDKKIVEAKMPAEVETEARKELDRLAKMPLGAAEYTVSRTYLDWLCSLPWSKQTIDNLDIVLASKVLNEDHYDLEKVKERILEYLAVRKKKNDMKGTILCFVGPPGVGKTSLGKSIARAMDRKFVRISLGGVKDEAEIRGHRRTYVGALPGKIIQGMQKSGFKNPVFMIDEIDKIGADFRGDPASALLEVLDPEQNTSFVDHYLSLPFDLSQVMFITTANMLDPIPSALLDRMEVLRLPGYILEEKIQIAKQHLLARQMKEHGITTDDIEIQDNTLQVIVERYTKEAGLRNFEREIATICRKVTKEIVSGKQGKQIITEDKVHEFLGPPKFYSEIAERTSTAGVATGMAWTPYGGDILFIESTSMKGNKNLALTGQLGDVMKESAQAALSLIRGRAKEYHIPEDFFANMDIHIHVPAGAIPKDGPSAGVTMAVSLISLLTNYPTRADIAMTGEITLRGKVLPVGGIREKVLAAIRAGIKKVILPEKNKRDLEEIPEKIRNQVEYFFVEDIDEVFNIALEEPKEVKEEPKELNINEEHKEAKEHSKHKHK
ncbi:endopeptidase La [Candidatus Poribacteria bacterium]|nr:endopeptidase La [Candidatus Poribacteria bacterium]